jgi:hypothetical protein
MISGGNLRTAASTNLRRLDERRPPVNFNDTAAESRMPQLTSPFNAVNRPGHATI